MRRIVTSERAVVAAVALAFAIPVLASISINAALGFDEAVYAQLTRHWLSGAPASGWAMYRPPGLSILGLIPQLLAPGAEWAMRLVGLVSGVATVLAGWWLARLAGGRGAGFVAAVALAAAAPLQVESATFLTDVPSTAILLLMTAQAWKHLSADAGVGRSSLLLAPMGAAAFYLRYGVIVAIVGLALGWLVVAPRSWRPLLATLALFGVLLLPHLVIATVTTGAPWGILVSAQRATGPSDSLPILAYLGWLPWQLIGPLGAIVALLAIRSRGRFARFIGVAVAVQMVSLGLFVHAEPRYVFLPVCLLVVLGAVEVGRLLSGRARLLRAATGVAVLALVLGGTLSVIETQARLSAWGWTRAVGLDIRQEVGADASCSVLTSDVPIVSWYSGCLAIRSVGVEAGTALTGAFRYVVARAGETAPSALGEPWRTYRDGEGRVVASVYRLP